MRRNVMRYMVLAFVITLMRISLRVKKRFPSWQHLVDSGEYDGKFLFYFYFRIKRCEVPKIGRDSIQLFSNAACLRSFGTVENHKENELRFDLENMGNFI